MKHTRRFNRPTSLKWRIWWLRTSSCVTVVSGEGLLWDYLTNGPRKNIYTPKSNDSTKFRLNFHLPNLSGGRLVLGCLIFIDIARFSAFASLSNERNQTLSCWFVIFIFHWSSRLLEAYWRAFWTHDAILGEAGWVHHSWRIDPGMSQEFSQWLGSPHNLRPFYTPLT